MNWRACTRVLEWCSWQGTWGTAGALTVGASEGAAWEGDIVLLADILASFGAL